MNRFKKAVLLSVYRLPYHINLIWLYFWSESRLYLLRAVHVLSKNVLPMAVPAFLIVGRISNLITFITSKTIKKGVGRCWTSK